MVIGLGLWNGISRGWLKYYEQPGPKFTEKQVRMADEAANILDKCYPIEDFVSGESHWGICESLTNNNFEKAGECLNRSVPPFNKLDCFEALKIGIGLLACTAPTSIRRATLNLLGCDHYFPSV